MPWHPIVALFSGSACQSSVCPRTAPDGRPCRHAAADNISSHDNRLDRLSSAFEDAALAPRTTHELVLSDGRRLAAYEALLRRVDGWPVVRARDELFAR